MNESPFLDKALESLVSSRASLELGCLNSAANRAYYACFHAVRAALVSAGVSSLEKRWPHDAIQGAFSQLIHRQKLYPSELRETMSRLLDIRELADYHHDVVGSRMARYAVRRADELVSAVQRRLAP